MSRAGTWLGQETYAAVLAESSARCWEALDAVRPEAAVPACPGWTARDLARHLAQVQAFWALIAGRGCDGDSARALQEPVPEAMADAVAAGRRATTDLVRALARRRPGEPCWSWSSEQTAGFTMRRQAHEALVHRMDAEETARLAAQPVSPRVAADGVDEFLHVLSQVEEFTGAPTAVVRLTAADAGVSWLIRVGTEPAGEGWPEGPAPARDLLAAAVRTWSEGPAEPS